MTQLPTFPVDDFTLTQLEHALNTSIEVLDDGSYKPVGGEFTMSKLLDFMSGYDPSRATLIGYTAGVCGEGDPAGAIPIYESWDQHYTEHDVIRALVARIRELEGGRRMNNKTIDETDLIEAVNLVKAAMAVLDDARTYIHNVRVGLVLPESHELFKAGEHINAVIGSRHLDKAVKCVQSVMPVPYQPNGVA